MTDATAGLIFQLLGVAAGLEFLRIRHRANKVSNWPTVQGEVIESRVNQDSDGNEPYIRYRFSVFGRTYENDRIYPSGGTISTTGSFASKFVSRYPVGSKIQVYYNPDRPSDSAIETDLPGFIKVLFLVVAVSFIFFGAYFL